MNLPERLFKLRENNTSVRKEIYAGIITFLAVAYILAVNPDILSSTGMPRGGLFYVTAIAAFIGTLAMAFVANAPLALAPAMGLNAFFAYSVVQTLGFSWQFALFAIVVEGVIFFFLSLSSIREKIINAIPLSLKYAMGAGVGIYITLIAFKNAHIVKAHPVTLVTIQNFFGPDFHTAGISAILALAGILFSAFLMHRKTPGDLLWGILGTWVLGIICQLTGIYHVDPAKGFYSLLPNFSSTALTEPLYEFCRMLGSAFKIDQWSCPRSEVSGLKLLLSADFAVICFAFLFTDFFDTVGTVNGAVACRLNRYFCRRCPGNKYDYDICRICSRNKSRSKNWFVDNVLCILLFSVIAGSSDFSGDSRLCDSSCARSSRFSDDKIDHLYRFE